MSLKVEHREDGPVQKVNQREIAPELKGTYIERVTFPMQKMALKFLDEKIIGVEFENEQKLQETLDTWPTYVQENGLDLHKNWKTIDINSDEAFIAFAAGLGGPLVIGIIQEMNKQEAN